MSTLYTIPLMGLVTPIYAFLGFLKLSDIFKLITILLFLSLYRS